MEHYFLIGIILGIIAAIISFIYNNDLSADSIFGNIVLVFLNILQSLLVAVIVAVAWVPILFIGGVLCFLAIVAG